MHIQSCIAALALFAVLPAAAQTMNPDWIADPKSGCRVWNLEPKPNQTISWSGQCPNTIAQGRGILQIYIDGKVDERYDADFRDGKPNGRGVYTRTNGKRYEGDFAEGYFNGQGTYTFANGDRYQGHFQNDDFSGHGVFIYKNGSRYEGEFRGDKPNGQGTYKLTDGRTYSGTWTNGCFRQGDRWATVMASAKDCGFQ